MKDYSITEEMLTDFGLESIKWFSDKNDMRDFEEMRKDYLSDKLLKTQNNKCICNTKKNGHCPKHKTDWY